MNQSIHVSRRHALKTMAAAAIGAGMSPAFAQGNSGGKRKMTINLQCGMIGVRANQREAIDLAHAHGFESVEAMPNDLAKMSDAEVKELLAEMKARKVVFGASGLPVDFRRGEGQFMEGLNALPRLADGLQRAGVTRVGTWISPGSNSLTYLENFRQHTRRLQEVVWILRDRGIRLGLEYVGTKTLRDRYKFPFVHCMAETKELLAEIKLPEAGFVLDSWHWWNANETAQDILTLEAKDVVAVDLNDAPAGIPKEKQIDGQRELPLATGVIPVGEFLNALQKLGYDGPVRAEPFNKALNELGNEEACAKTAEAIRKAFELLKV